VLWYWPLTVWPWTFVRLWRDQTPYQILARLNHSRAELLRFKCVAILDFTGSGYWQFHGLRESITLQHAELMTIWPISPVGRFLSVFRGGGIPDAHYLRESGPNYIKFVEDTGQSLRNKALVLDFTYLALFQHDSGWNASNVENRRYICTFDPLSVNSDLTGSEFRTFSASGQPHYTSVSNLNTIRLYIQLRYW